MSCTTKIDYSTPAEPMLLGLIARRPKRWIDHQCPPAENSRAAGDIVRNGLADSENTDPEHIWGDEGPVTD